MKNNQLLKFSLGNAKLSNDTLIFDIPAGYTCPAAKNCLAFANRKTGKIKDGKNIELRCYAASQEAVYSNVRKKRWDNYSILKSAKNVNELVQIIEYSLLKNIKRNTKKVRIHSSGDYFSLDYLKAWIQIAKRNKSLIFYSYTKSVHFFKQCEGEIPSNFRITFSHGGKYDSLIEDKDKSAKVVFSPEEAKLLKLKIDHDDSNAYSKSKKSFSLLIHNTQPKNSKAAKAWQEVKTTIGGYSR
jgi:hypothetical protein